jgi:hypothetical protein
MISKLTATGMISLLTVLFLPYMFNNPRPASISNIASKGEAEITVQKMNLDARYDYLITIVKQDSLINVKPNR